MKTKLLRKVRKRFTITHYPKGIRIFDFFYDGNVFQLTDNTNNWWDIVVELKSLDDNKRKKFCERIGSNEKECVDILVKEILIKLRYEYPNLGSKGHNRIPKKKVWYLK